MAAARRRGRAAAAGQDAAARSTATPSRRGSTPRTRRAISCRRPAGSRTCACPPRVAHVRVDTGVRAGRRDPHPLRPDDRQADRLGRRPRARRCSGSPGARRLRDRRASRPISRFLRRGRAAPGVRRRRASTPASSSATAAISFRSPRRCPTGSWRSSRRSAGCCAQSGRGPAGGRRLARPVQPVAPARPAGGSTTTPITCCACATAESRHRADRPFPRRRLRPRPAARLRCPRAARSSGTAASRRYRRRRLARDDRAAGRRHRRPRRWREPPPDPVQPHAHGARPPRAGRTTHRADAGQGHRGEERDRARG